VSILEAYLKEKKELIDLALPLYLPPIDTYPKIIHEAMHYGVAVGGKRLRPILALTTAELVGFNDQKAIMPLLCSLEYIHTYSLIHDDLPAMDDDDFRRGKPSCHRVFDEGIAILAGDALLTYAFELLTKLARPQGPFSEGLVLQMISKVSHAIGTKGLIGGQVVDLQSENKIINLETLKFIHGNKTAALFETAMVTGAMLGNASKKQMKAIKLYANAFGLAFQISDDILDIKGDTVLLGKTVGSDEKKNKATYPSLLGLEKAEKLMLKCISDGKTALNIFGNKGRLLTELIEYIANRRI